MTTTSTANIDQATVDRLSEGFHRCFSELVASHLLPPHVGWQNTPMVRP